MTLIVDCLNVAIEQSYAGTLKWNTIYTKIIIHLVSFKNSKHNDRNIAL